MKKVRPAPTASRRLALTLAALRTARSRLYGALGNKGLPNDADLRVELWGMHHALNNLCPDVARLMLRVRRAEAEALAAAQLARKERAA